MHTQPTNQKPHHTNHTQPTNQPHTTTRALTTLTTTLLTALTLTAAPTPHGTNHNNKNHAHRQNHTFDQLAFDYIDQAPYLSPITATKLGNHGYDHLLDQITPIARQQNLHFQQQFLQRLNQIDRKTLTRNQQIDAALLHHQLNKTIWHIQTYQDWAWNPLIYTQKAGAAIYNLLAREFAPLQQRLQNATQRLEKLPTLLQQTRQTLQPKRIPPIHAQTAIQQNQGLHTLIQQTLQPHIHTLPQQQQTRLQNAITTASNAIQQHHHWLTNTALPQAQGNFRIQKHYSQKLKYALHTTLTPRQIKKQAQKALKTTRQQMYQTAQQIYKQRHPHTQFPKKPDNQYQQAIIRAALEHTYQNQPNPNQITQTIQQQIQQAKQFTQQKNIVTIPDTPLQTILMPPFKQGITIAYCDPPGPLEKHLTTFYAISPIPKHWTPQQTKSYLREYNTWSLHNLTMHEAIPGHHLQIAHSNQHHSTLRALLQSGTFIEGWANYAEQIMINNGYLNHDPRMKLTNLKWQLRSIANALIDQAIHTDNMTKQQALQLMIEQTFQEPTEANAKWTRAQLTAAQLSTYFIGTQQHWQLRKDTQKKWGKNFTPKKYHDQLLSHGSPPIQYIRALLHNQPIPNQNP